VPLPSRWRIVIDDPMPGLDALAGRAEDTVLVNELNEQLRGRVHTLLQRALTARDETFF
jgi:hypothetical protein